MGTNEFYHEALTHYRTPASHPKVHFDLRFHSDGLAAPHAGLELPLLHGFDGLFIQPETEAAQHTDIDRPASRIHLNVQRHGTLILRGPGFFRKLRLDLIYKDLRGDS